MASGAVTYFTLILIYFLGRRSS